jgi:CubicO group peptidase (beta-lactamase class C family)
LFATLNASAASSDKLDEFVLATMRQWAVPGMAVAVVRDDQVVLARGYGVRDASHPEPVDANTIFGIGSMTKSFTAAAAASLVDEGKLDWDRPVVEVVSTYRLRDPWVTAAATVRDLASHRVGVDADLLWMAGTWSSGSTLARARNVRASGRFGDFMYSNLGFLTLGAVVEAASGASWDENIHSRLLEPLGMRRTSTREDEYIEASDLAACWLCNPPARARIGGAALKLADRNAASPHGLKLDAPLAPSGGRVVEVWPWRYEGAIAPAGAVNSTANDMARWLRMQLNEGMLDGHRVLSVRQVREMHAFQLAQSRVEPDDRPLSEYERRYSLSGYGLGWTKHIYRGFEVSSHGGGQVGFGGTMWIVPSRKLGIVVLQNLDYRHAPAFSAVMLRLVDHHLGLPPLPANDEIVKHWSESFEGRELQTALPATRSIDPALAARMTGEYSDAALGRVTVERTDAGLWLVFGAECRAQLRQRDAIHFIAEFASAGNWLIPVTLHTSADGAIDALLIAERGMEDAYRLQRVTRQEPRP